MQHDVTGSESTHMLWIDDARYIEVAYGEDPHAAASSIIQDPIPETAPLAFRIALRLARVLERWALLLSAAMTHNPVKTRGILATLFIVFGALGFRRAASAAGACSNAAGFLNTVNNDLCNQGQNFFTGSFTVGDSIFGVVATIAIMVSLGAYLFEHKSTAGALQKLLNVIFVIAIPWGILKFAETVLPGWLNVALNLGNTITGGAITPNPDSIFTTGAGLAGQMMTSVADVELNAARSAGINVAMALTALFAALIAIVGALILLVSFTLLAVEMLVAFCQGYIALSVGAFQLGWSASGSTSSFATAYWGLVSTAITRIIVTMAIIAIALNEAKNWIAQIKALGVLNPNVTPNLLGLLQIPLLGVALLFLVIKVTEFAAAQLSGRPVYSAGAAGAVGAGRAVGGVGGAIGGAMGGGVAGGVAGAVRGGASGGSIESAVSGGLSGAMGGAARAGRAGGKAGAQAGGRAGSSVRRN